MKGEKSMTGRELILWILVNHLEDELMFQDGSIPGFLTIDQYAVTHEVGLATVQAWVKMGSTPHIKIGDTIYIPQAVIMEKDIEQ